MMDLLTAGSMMAMPDVKEILSAEVTTARSSGRITTLEMTAVRSQPAQAAALTGECQGPASLSSSFNPSGFFPNAECVFPFVYKGVRHTECTWEDAEYRHNQPWCATAVSSGSLYIHRQWGNCGPSCPVETPSPALEQSQVPLTSLNTLQHSQ